jgi:hypothetical protein
MLCRTYSVACRQRPTVRNYKLTLLWAKACYVQQQGPGTWRHDVDGLTQCIDIGVCLFRGISPWALFLLPGRNGGGFATNAMSLFLLIMSFIDTKPLFGLKSSGYLINFFIVSEKCVKPRIYALKPRRMGFTRMQADCRAKHVCIPLAANILLSPANV